MAYLLKLYCDDTTHDYNLLTDTLRLVEGSRKVTRNGNSYVQTMDLISAVGSTDINIILAENELAQMGDICRKWKADRSMRYPVWLQENASGETLRRSLVTDMRLRREEGNYTSMLLGRQGVSMWTLFLEYNSWSEPVTETAVTASSVSTWGGIWRPTITSYKLGTMDARITNFGIKSLASNVYGHFWVGIRTPREAGSNTFQSVYELEHGNWLIGYDTDSVMEAGGSPNDISGDNCVRVDFATHDEMAVRGTAFLSDMWTTGNAKYQAGRYLVLLRCKVSSNAIVRVRMLTGLNAAQHALPDLDVSNTSWALVPLGEIQIPSVPFRNELANLLDLDHIVSSQIFTFYAERLTVAGNIWFDALCLIPSDHLLYAECHQDVPVNYWLSFLTYADQEKIALFGTPSSSGYSGTDHSMTNWSLPQGDNPILVIAGQRSIWSGISHSLSAAVDLSLKYVPRWEHFSPYA